MIPVVVVQVGCVMLIAGAGGVMGCGLIVTIVTGEMHCPVSFTFIL
jgi:hypothetical protein